MFRTILRRWMIYSVGKSFSCHRCFSCRTLLMRRVASFIHYYLPLRNKNQPGVYPGGCRAVEPVDREGQGMVLSYT